MTIRVRYTEKVTSRSPNTFRGVHTSRSYAEAGGCSRGTARRLISKEIEAGHMELVEKKEG